VRGWRDGRQSKGSVVVVAQANASAARDEGEEGSEDEHLAAETRPSAPSATAARVTVNLSENSVEALDAAVQLTRNTKTEVINKAVQLFAVVQQAQHEGGGVSIKDSKEAEWTRVRFF